MAEQPVTASGGCVFCRICLKEDAKTEILFEDAETVVFRDIKPCTTHHYLVVTKEHIYGPKSLKKPDSLLVQQMVTNGRQVLQTKGADMEDVRLGFHWPPFTSVNHLHMHAISPVSGMNFISKGIYRPGTPWFVTSDWLLDHLAKDTSAK